MKILILGGAGLQGKAVLHDLSKCPTVKEMVCVDVSLESLADFKKFLNTDKITFQRLDVKNREVLIPLMKDRVDIVIDVLPSGFTEIVVEAALEAKVNVVNTRYGHTVPRGLNKKALEKGITFMPESGLDPGIDLVLCGYGVSQMDEVSELHSY